MARKGIKDFDKNLFEEILPFAETYREALTNLGVYYCSGAIAQVRAAAQKYNIDISHLEGKNSKSVNDVQQRLTRKFRKRNEINKQLRRGTTDDYAIFILSDSKRNDKVKNQDNDLTLDFIKSILSANRCFYCENTNCKFTLDRIDNNLGHLQNNVNICCDRCNTLRGNMPYDAWLHICPAIKSARELGLFDNWMPYNLRSRFG